MRGGGATTERNIWRGGRQAPVRDKEGGGSQGTGRKAKWRKREVKSRR